MRAEADFTTDVRVIWIAVLALVIGAICSVVAVALMWMIGLFTNLFFYHQLATAPGPAQRERRHLRELEAPGRAQLEASGHGGQLTWCTSASP